jgi:hypothetical protein
MGAAQVSGKRASCYGHREGAGSGADGAEDVRPTGARAGPFTNPEHGPRCLAGPVAQ